MSKVPHTGIFQLKKAAVTITKSQTKRLLSQISQRTYTYNNYRFVYVKKIMHFSNFFFLSLRDVKMDQRKLTEQQNTVADMAKVTLWSLSS